jgi:hypothetical protein
MTSSALRINRFIRPQLRDLRRSAAGLGLVKLDAMEPYSWPDWLVNDWLNTLRRPRSTAIRIRGALKSRLRGVLGPGGARILGNGSDGRSR